MAAKTSDDSLPTLDSILQNLDALDDELNDDVGDDSIDGKHGSQNKYLREVEELKAQVLNTRIEDSVYDFVDSISDEVLMVSSLGLDSIQQLEQQRSDAEAARLRGEDDRHRKKLDEIETSQRDALASIQKARVRVEQILQERSAEEKERMKYAFLKAEQQLALILKRRKGEVKRYYGDLQRSAGQFMGRQGRVYRLDWSQTPQPLRLDVHRISGLRDRLKRGKYVLTVSLLDRLGGHVIKWDRPYGYSESAFVHSGQGTDVHTPVRQSLVTLYPPESALLPSMCLVVECFRLKGTETTSYVDCAVGWGVFPAVGPDGTIIGGKFKLPLLRGEYNHSITQYADFHSRAANPKDWLGNMYFECTKESKYKPGQKEFEVQLQHTSVILGFPKRFPDERLPTTATQELKSLDNKIDEIVNNLGGDNNIDRSSNSSQNDLEFDNVMNAVELVGGHGSGDEQPEAEKASEADDKGNEVDTKPTSNKKENDKENDKENKHLRTEPDQKSSRKNPPGKPKETDSLKAKESSENDETLNSNIHDPEDVIKPEVAVVAITKPTDEKDSVDQQSVTLTDNPNIPYKMTKTQKVIGSEESGIAFSVALKQSASGGEKIKMEFIDNDADYLQSLITETIPQSRISKFSFVVQNLRSEFGTHRLFSREFWELMFFIALVFWLRTWVHYLFQWIYLKAEGIPIINYEFQSLSMNLVFHDNIMYTNEVVGVVCMGVVGNILLFGFCCVLDFLWQSIVSPTMVSVALFLLAYGVETILDPTLILIQDLIYERWKYRSGEGIGDAFKLYWHMENSDSSGLTGAVLTVYIYLVLMATAISVFYAYMVYVHRNGSLRDVYNRMNAPEYAFSLPDDRELSVEDLAGIIRRAKRWRGADGSIRTAEIIELSKEEENTAVNDDNDDNVNETQAANEEDGNRQEKEVMVRIFEESPSKKVSIWRKFHWRSGRVIELETNVEE